MARLPRLHNWMMISVVIYVAGLAGYSFWSYNEHKSQIMKQVDEKLFESAMSIDYLLPSGFHDRAIDRDSISSIEFFECLYVLSKQSENFHVKYLYTVVLKNNKIYFTSSSATGGELLTGENLTHYWDEYSEANEGFFHAFDSNNQQYIEHTDRWGTFKTIMIPRISQNGHEYLLCADIETSFIDDLLLAEIPYTLGKALLLLLLVLPFLIVVIKNFKKESAMLEEKVSDRTTALVAEIEKRKVSEESIRFSEEKFSVAFNRTPVIMFLTDLQTGIIVDANEYFEKHSGIKRSKIIGSHVLSVPFFESARDFEIIRDRVKNDGLIRNFEIRYRAGAGNGYCSYSGEVIDFHGKQHLLSIVFDLSERVKFEKELLQAKDKAEESDRLKSTFLANMSHEVRTPLNGIIGFADLLIDPGLDEKTRNEYVSIITSNGRNLLALINDIIDISKIEAGQLKISENRTDINDVLRQLQGQFTKTLEESGKSGVGLFMVQGLPDAECHINTDEFRFRQILVNLLSNAVKFTDTGRIEFGYTTAVDYLHFYVRDSGIGIQPRDQKLVFERFKQAESGNTRKYGGTGLGLAITRALVELLGGTITLKSETGKGSEFGFTLPFKQAYDLDASKKKSMEVESRLLDWTGKTVLIVEDDEPSYIYLKVILQRYNATVLFTDNGKSAIEMVKSNPEIDLVLMDLNIPVINGFVATQEIKKLRPSLKVVAETAYAMADDRERAIACGCNDYLPKPIQREKLLSTLQYYLGPKTR